MGLSNTLLPSLVLIDYWGPLQAATISYLLSFYGLSSDARINSEVLTLFRSIRMFFYLAFIPSALFGGLIATSRLNSALANAARSGQVVEILKGLEIDISVASLFVFLYLRENKSKNAQMARLFREENLAKYKMRVQENKEVISVGDLRRVAWLLICVGLADYIEQAFKRSREFTQGLVERGVVVTPVNQKCAFDRPSIDGGGVCRSTRVLFTRYN